MSEKKVKNKIQKFILLLFSIFMTIMCLIGIFSLFMLLRYADFQQGKAVITIIFLLLITGFGIIAFKCFRHVFHKHKTEQDSTTKDFPVLETSVSLSSVPDDITAKSEHSAEYIEFKNTIQRVDEKLISDEEVPYLIQVGYESALERKNAKPQRTSREEDLCVNFMINHSSDIQRHVDKFENLYKKAYHEKNIELKIDLLKQTIFEYEKAKNWFSRTKGGTIYFEDMYEHLYNSKNNDFSYIDSVQNMLDYYINNRDVVIPQILSAIGNNGIIQKNIYDLVDSDKSNIQKVIRELESMGKIKREKKGNSYLLTLP